MVNKMVLTAWEEELLFRIRQLEKQSQKYADKGMDEAAINCLEHANTYREKIEQEKQPTI